MFAMLILLLATTFYVGYGDQVIVAGDSWGSEGWSYLQNVLSNHSNTKHLKVKSYAVGGTTTKDWIKPVDKLVNDINQNSDVEYLWLSIGGNDAAQFLPECTLVHPYPDLQCINHIMSEMTNNTIKMLEPVFAQHPTIQVIQFGYDILNFGITEDVTCAMFGEVLIFGCNDEPLCINTQFIKLQYQFIADVKKHFGGQSDTGPQQGVDRAGQDMKGYPIELNSSDYNICWGLCNKTQGCEAWAYGIPGCDQYKNPMCWLKSGDPSTSRNKCRVSGAEATPPYNYNNINLLGTLQMDDPKHRYPNVTVTNPDLTRYSPGELIQRNCIHPTRPTGFMDVFNEMYEVYWKNI
eukprot:274905_1